MSNVTLKDTKNVIYDAYKELLKKKKDLENTKIDTAKVVQDKANKEVIQSAEEIIGLNILSFEIVEKYNKLNQAIELKETELKELFNIEKEANTLVALINAYIDKKAELETKYKEKEIELNKRYSEKEAEFKELLKKLDATFSKETKELKRQFEEQKTLLEKERERNEEEYQYALDRKRKLENDQWQDEKAQREKILKEKELAVTEREQHIKEMEETISTLKEQVDNIPELIEQTKKETEEKITKELARQHAIEKNSITKNCDWEKKITEQKNESLTKELDKANANITELQSQLNESYKEIKEIATQTVQSSGGVRIVETSKKD